MAKRVRTLLEWWVLSLKPIASHLLHHPKARIIYGNLRHTGNQPGVCPSKERQVISSAGQWSKLGMTTTGSSHFLLTNPMVLELFSLLSLLSSVLWLIEYNSLGLGFLNLLSHLSSIPRPLESQRLVFGITQFLISLVPFKINPLVLGFHNPLAPFPSIPWFWDCSILLSLRCQHHHTNSPQPVPTRLGKGFLKPHWLL